MPAEIADREDFGQFVDGYDTGVRYADDHFGRLLDCLEEHGVLNETLIVFSADHGENLGELNVYGDHTTADDKTCRLPLVINGPGVEPGVDDDFHYQLDLGPSLLDLAGVDHSAGWDGQSFASSFTDGESRGRDYLVFGHGA